jgi:hypothetical protein
MCPESLQLRMVTVPLGVAPEHFLREQGLPPQRDETPGVQVFGM